MAQAVAPRQPHKALSAGLLLRVSDARQADEDRFSVDAQRRVLSDRCRREGWTPVAEYVGEGESAFTNQISKRRTIQQMLDDARAGRFHVLLVHDLSRFARDEELGHAVFNILDGCGVRLVNASSDIDYSTAEGRMMLSIDLGLGSYWSRKMSFHIRKSKREKFEMGLHLGDVPFGYTKGATNKDALVVVAGEAAAIREAFRDRLAGAGYTEIARRWNAAGLKPRSKQGNDVFAASAVQSVLENDFYAGFIRHKGERRAGIHEAIITEDQFLAAQAQVKTQATRAAEPWLFSGIATCSECGGAIWQHRGGTKHTYAYYREASQRQLRRCPIAGALWDRRDAESRLDEMVHAMALDKAWLADVDRDARRVPRQDDGQRDKLLAKKNRAMKLYVAGDMSESEWLAFKHNSEEQIARLPVMLPQTLSASAAKLTSIGQIWEGMTMPERREAVRVLFEEVGMDARRKELRLKPWPEFEGLFSHRRELCGRGTPGRTRTCAHGLGNHCSIL